MNPGAFKTLVTYHLKKYVSIDDRPNEKIGKYNSWKENNNIVMSWFLNNVQLQIASTIIDFYTIKEM